MYSQNNEEKFILDYFQHQAHGYLLDIGANDGQTLSNSFALIKKGWSALLVEPAPTAFKKLKELHADNSKVQCIDVAVSNVDGSLTFFSSGTHLGNGDTDLLSTLKREELEKWKSSGEKFEAINVMSVSFRNLMAMSDFKSFDFITIDAEGVDLLILMQMDLTDLGCNMIIVEHNGKNKSEFCDYITSFGLKLIHENAENFIFVR